MRGHSPNFHIHVSGSDLYIPTIDLSILLQEICGPILEIYINRSHTHECGNWDWGHTIPRKGIRKWDFLCSVLRRILPPYYHVEGENDASGVGPEGEPQQGEFRWLHHLPDQDTPRPATRQAGSLHHLSYSSYKFLFQLSKTIFVQNGKNFLVADEI
jgi:hypothetical protein